ncbi:MAG: orotidine-5'-phosphate decarboxylase [Planctomycetota bacterium]|nr:MAG: orotidine-5'-phosphate decarboxylase [Planctomycetota bacterium]
MTQTRIIIALDGMLPDDAMMFAQRVSGHVWGFKMNDLFFRDGAAVLPEFRKLGGVFCDAKFHDIPNTVANSVSMLVEEGAADLATVHASGGPDMIKAAVRAADGKLKIIAVTALTSLDDATAKAIYGVDAGATVRKLAQIAADGGADGIVCSPHELAEVRSIFPGLETVVPGIRPAWYGKADDQSRAATPADAASAGATYLVIGRPVTGADDPIEALEKISAEISGE